MDVTCPKCGATNRSTSRFCARCGEPLSPTNENAAAQAGSDELNLPWLQAVQERAVRRTGEITPEMISPEKGTQADEPASTSKQEQPDTQAVQPVSSHAAEQNQAQLEQPEPAEPTEPPPPEADEPPPDWVVGILEPGTEAAQPKAEEGYEPEELAHIMPWLGNQQGEEATSQPGQPGQPGLPPWLSGITVQETLETQQPSTEQTQPATAADLEMEGLQPFIPPEMQETQEASEQSTAAAQVSAEPEKLPEWIRRIESKKTPEPEPQEAQPTLERFTPITQVVLSPTDTLGTPIIREIPVKPPRPGAVETLAALIQNPANSAPHTVASPTSVLRPSTAGVSTRRSPFMRWLLPDGLIYLIVAGVLLAVLIARPPFGQVSAPAATEAIQFFNAVDAAPKDKPALLVFDWDASRSAEMSALSAAVTNHLMARHIRFVTVSTVPQGPGFAEQITHDAATDPKANYGYTYGRDYLVLGYLPGGEAALRSLAGDITSILPIDYVNNNPVVNTDMARAGELRTLEDFGIVIDLAANETSLRTWIEQVASRTRVPMVAAVPQALEPQARPYRNIPGAGLRALVSGQPGALQYEEQLTSHNLAPAAFNKQALEDRLNAQSVAQLLVALAILGAFVTMGTRRIFRR